MARLPAPELLSPVHMFICFPLVWPCMALIGGSSTKPGSSYGASIKAASPRSVFICQGPGPIRGAGWRPWPAAGLDAKAGVSLVADADPPAPAISACACCQEAAASRCPRWPWPWIQRRSASACTYIGAKPLDLQVHAAVPMGLRK